MKESLFDKFPSVDGQKVDIGYSNSQYDCPASKEDSDDQIRKGLAFEKAISDLDYQSIEDNCPRGDLTK